MNLAVILFYFINLLEESGDLYGWGDNVSGKLALKDAQSVNKPKLLEILKGKSTNHIALGFECSIISTSDYENSIVFKETQPKL
jgi:hypothetical protein